MINYNSQLENVNIQIVNKNVLSLYKYEKMTDNKKATKFDNFAFDICYFASLVHQLDKTVKSYKGKNKKAFKIEQLNKLQIADVYSQLGKNNLTALKKIGASPEKYWDAYQNADTKITTDRGFANLIKPENSKKEIDEKITNFIKSNTTKKEDDGKMTIAELSKMFGEIAQKMLKENNKNVVDFLPSADDIAVNQ